MESRQESINTVRTKVNKDLGRLWDLPAVVALARKLVGTSENIMADKLIDERLDGLALNESLRNMFVTVIGFALMIPSGGASVVAARVVTSGLQAMASLEKYQFESALASTDLDKRAHAIAAEDPSFFWVAADVVFFAVDGMAALKEVRALRPLAREALLAKEGTDAIESANKLSQAADQAGGKPGLGQRLLNSLASIRKRPLATRLLGEAGEAEAKAIVRSSEAIAKEANEAMTLASFGGHEVKVTRSGHLVVCTECSWLRERFARELAEDPHLYSRVIDAEEKAAKGALSAGSKSDIAALTKDLQTARDARLVAELGPLAAKAAAVGDLRAAYQGVLGPRRGLAHELDELEQALAAGNNSGPKDLAKFDQMQGRLARLRELEGTSKAPRNASILEVSFDKSAANFYEKVAETVPNPPVVLEFPDGTRVWREYIGGPIQNEAQLGGSVGRAGMERGFFSRTEHGNLPVGPKYERAHSLGQGTGFESPYGLYYAPQYVNQTLQNQGVETYMRQLAAIAKPGETFQVVTNTLAHPASLRLAGIDYSIVRVVNGKAEQIASYTIRVSNSAEHPLVTATALQFSSTPAGQAVRGSTSAPDILKKPVSFAY